MTPPGSPCANARGSCPVRRSWCSVDRAVSAGPPCSWPARWEHTCSQASRGWKRGPAMLAAGAHAVIDLSSVNLRDTLREQVYAATDGRGADIILDPLGSTVFDAALRALAWSGRLVVIGFAAGGIPMLKTNYPLLKNIKVSGLQVSDYRKRRSAQVAACYEELFALYEKGKMHHVASTVFLLVRARVALA